MLLILWGSIGALWLLWVGISAMIPQGGKPVVSNGAPAEVLVGEFSDFELAFPPRGRPFNQFVKDGKKVSLKDFHGKVVLVNLWATWCGPCVDELPSLNRLQAEMGGDDFTVVAIAAEARMEERGPAFFDRLNIENLELFHDPSLDFTRAMGGNMSLPLTIIYDAKGNEVGRFTGAAHWDSAEAKALLRAVIEGRKLS